MRRKLSWFLICLAVLAGVFVVSRISFTQSPKQERIAGPIAGSPVVWLEGNRRPMFQPENDQGPAPDSLKLENITLTFKPTEEQQGNLAALLEQQQDPSSPLYHHWLTPEQFADQFGLSASDVAKVTDWLQSQGFTISQRARSRLWISFSGTAAQVRSAFHTEIHNYSLDGKTYYANASEPAVPAALADVVLGFSSLDNYGPKPHSVFRQVADVAPGFNPASAAPKGSATPETRALPVGGVQPDFTSYISGNHYLAPGDFAVIYDVNPLYNSGTDGTGQKIAVMGQTDLYNDGSGPASDVTRFRSVSGLPANAPQIILVPGVSDPGVTSSDIDEASLDVEWSGAVAKNATIIYVNGGASGVYSQSLPYAVDNNLAPVITLSYGNCEANWSASNRGSFATVASQANTQGQTILVASGDSGAADCDYSSSASSPVTTATHGLAVDYPASSPLVTGMGGTEFNEGTGNYWAPAPGTTDVSPSALSYIPEVVWNDTLSSLNTSKGLLAGGGGASIFYAKPSWQAGTGVPGDGMRDVPDVSMNASSLHDGYLVCVQGSCVSGYRNPNNPTTPNALTVAGGTSAGAPTFGAIVALINEFTGSRQGNINPTLYSLAARSPAAFHDILTGNNIVPCTSGTTGCPASGQIGYTAGVGYDQASGLGSVDVHNLVTLWNSSGVGNLPAPTLIQPANGATGVALLPTFAWTAVTGNAGYRIMVATSPASLPTNPATSTCAACTIVDTIPTPSQNPATYSPPSALTQGTYYWQVQAIEPSSSTGMAAWSVVFSFTTTGGTLAAPTLTAPANGATAVAIPPTFTWTTVTGNGGYRIAMATTQAALPTDPSAGTCTACTFMVTTTAPSFTPTASQLAGGTTYYWEVQALPSAGGGQNGPWSTVFTFTTVSPDFSLGVSPSSLTIAPGGSGTSTLTLTPTNGLVTSSVSLSCSVSATLAGVTCSVGTLSGNNTATVTITASSSASSYPALPRNPHFGGWWVVGVAMLGLLLIALSRRRPGGVQAPLWNFGRVALGAVLAAVLLASLSCGGGSSGASGGISTPTSQPESGIVTVTGTSTSATHSVQISVSVS